MRHRMSLFGAAVALVLLFPQFLPAHEESHPVAGSKLSMSDPAGRPDKRKFQLQDQEAAVYLRRQRRPHGRTQQPYCPWYRQR